jgi:hypothetical protein
MLVPLGLTLPGHVLIHRGTSSSYTGLWWRDNKVMDLQCKRVVGGGTSHDDSQVRHQQQKRARQRDRQREREAEIGFQQ